MKREGKPMSGAFERLRSMMSSTKGGAVAKPEPKPMMMLGSPAAPNAESGEYVVPTMDMVKAYVDGRVFANGIIRHKDFLYEVPDIDLDYDFAYDYMERTYKPDFSLFGAMSKRPHRAVPRMGGGCSVVRKGNFFGRNFDWTYDDKAYFVIRTPAIHGRHATVGMAGNVNGLTDDFVKTRNFSEEGYRILPFFTFDGINDAGVFAATLVAPPGDKGFTTGTNRDAPTSMCVHMAIRFILDNFDNAHDAAYAFENINNYGMYAKDGSVSEELHFLVGDPRESYVVEFINNRTTIHKVGYGEEYPIRPILTNFHVTDTQYDRETGHIVESTCEDHANGIERYNKIGETVDGITTFEQMQALMVAIKYTNAYNREMNPYWYSEVFGDYTEMGGGDVTIHTPKGSYDTIIDIFIDRFLNRTRTTDKDKSTWQSVFSCTYDIEKRSFAVVSQEESIANALTFKLKQGDK